MQLARPVVGLLALLQLTAASALPSEQDLSDRLDAFVKPYVARGSFNGIILVAEGDHVVLSRSYGSANYEHQVPVSYNTRFRIASLSKQFTLAAIAVLIDDKKLTMDSQLSEFLPDYPRGSEITISHLINHRSGIPHTNDLAAMQGRTRMDLAEILEVLKQEGLDFEPGSQENYSNGGFDVLAAVIENVSGLSYENFLKTHVLGPLDLEHTGQLHPYNVVPNLAQGYLPGSNPGERSQARFYPASIRYGGGSLYARGEDVWRLFRNTFTRRFASKSTSDALFWDASKRYEITGRSPGFVAKVFIDIPNDITVVSLANNYSFIPAWGRQLYQIALNEPWEAAIIDLKTGSVPQSMSRYYAGIYQVPNQERVEISLGGDGQVLYSDLDNDWQVALLPLGNRRFLHPFFDTSCYFEGDDRAKALICKPTLSRIDEMIRYERVD